MIMTKVTIFHPKKVRKIRRIINKYLSNPIVIKNINQEEK